MSQQVNPTGMGAVGVTDGTGMGGTTAGMKGMAGSSGGAGGLNQQQLSQQRPQSQGQGQLSAPSSDPFSSFFGGGDPFGMGMLSDPFSYMNRLMGGDMGMGQLGLPRMGGELMTGGGGRMGGALMKLDIKENEREFRITADVPGVAKDQIKLEVDAATNTLHVSTSRRDEKEDRGETPAGWTYHRLERASGSSYRSLRLPPTADANSAKAAVEHGVLTITVPKAAGAHVGRKQIAVA